jgi:hypothetical protein
MLLGVDIRTYSEGCALSPNGQVLAELIDTGSVAAGWAEQRRCHLVGRLVELTAPLWATDSVVRTSAERLVPSVPACSSR